MDYICENFRVTDEEYKRLDEKFGDLAFFASWQLLRRNLKNNHTDEAEDIVQDLRWSICKSASYYKRQVYLEDCIQAVRDHSKNKKVLREINQLEDLWKNRTKHGANKQKFGEQQEKILDELVSKHVPLAFQPNKQRPLTINAKFTTYCKAIVWNCQKGLGKKITREKSIRSGSVSLSEFDYLVSSDGKVSVVEG